MHLGQRRPPLRVRGRHPVQQRVQRPGHVAARQPRQAARRDRLLVAGRAAPAYSLGARGSTRQQRVQRRAQRVHVGGGTGSLPAQPNNSRAAYAGSKTAPADGAARWRTRPRACPASSGAPCPSKRMLAGRTSRCSTPRRCAECSASASRTPIQDVRHRERAARSRPAAGRAAWAELLHHVELFRAGRPGVGDRDRARVPGRGPRGQQFGVRGQPRAAGPPPGASAPERPPPGRRVPPGTVRRCCARPSRGGAGAGSPRAGRARWWAHRRRVRLCRGHRRAPPPAGRQPRRGCGCAGSLGAVPARGGVHWRAPDRL